jgi:hypothetical protein
VLDNRQDRVVGLDLVQYNLKRFVIDVIEVLSAVCLLQVLFVFLLLTINLLYKLPVVFLYLSTSSLVYKSVFGFDLLVQYLLFFLKFKDVLVRRKSMSDMLRYIFQSTQIASNAYVCKGTDKPIDR